MRTTVQRRRPLLRLLVLAGWICLPAAARQLPAQLPDGTRSGFFVTSDSVRLHYLERGRGPAIVLVPGWMMPGEIFAPQLDGLADEFRVIALDPRSQGMSEIAAEGHTVDRRATDIAELIAHLQLENVVLVGWSLGVPEVLTMAAQHGTAALRALVLVDGFVGADRDPAAPSPLRPVLAALQADRAAFTAAFVRSMFRRSQPEPYVKRITGLALRTPTPVAFTLLGNLMLGSGDWRPALGGLQLPVLYVVQPSLRAQMEVVRLLRPDARVELFEQAGHALFVDDAPRFNMLLRDFSRAQR